MSASAMAERATSRAGADVLASPVGRRGEVRPLGPAEAERRPCVTLGTRRVTLGCDPPFVGDAGSAGALFVRAISHRNRSPLKAAPLPLDRVSHGARVRRRDGFSLRWWRYRRRMG